MGLEQTPEVLTQKSREIIASLGYERRPRTAPLDWTTMAISRNTWRKMTSPHTGDAVLAARPLPAAILVPPKAPMLWVASKFSDNLLDPGIVTRSDPPSVLLGHD